MAGRSFKVSNVVLGTLELAEFNISHVGIGIEKGKGKGPEFLQGSTKGAHYSGRHSFVLAAVSAYNEHFNLVIRPDDVWVAILTQFSAFVNEHSEELRSSFVDFEGKKKLTVKAAGTLRSVDYGPLARAMEEQITCNIKDPKIRSWIVPNFSTTTASDRVVGSVVLMATLQKYFSYGFGLLCGLPSVTLLGDVEDWVAIRKRAERLVEYPTEKMEQWSKLLLPVLDKFVETAKGNEDKDWWNSIAHYEGGGSGPTYLSGWITAFCVYNSAGKWCVRDGSKAHRVNTDSIPSGFVSVPVEVDDNGTLYNTTMYAGHMAVNVLDTNTIAPRLDWMITLDK